LAPARNLRSRGREWLWLLLTLAGLVVIYIPGLGNLPVFDDTYFVDGGIASAFSTLHARPRMLSYGTFLWLQSIAGDALWVQRLFNLALHVAVTLALWAFYREILRSVAPPVPEPGEREQPYHDSLALGVAIAFFALNPVAVYAVAYLIQRSIVMATLFVTLGLWFFARGVRERRVWMHAGAVACYAAAVFSKENAILAPLAALPVYILVARPSRQRLGVVLAVVGVLVAAGAAILWKPLGRILGAPFDEFSRVYLVQLAALDPDAPRRALGLSMMNEAWLFFEYGVRWFLPFGEWMAISMRPPFPLKWLSFPHALGVAGYLATLAGGSWLLLRHRDWRALLGLSLLIPALLFATEFMTVWVQDPFVLYRSYLWAIGVPAIVVVAFHGLSPRATLAIGLVVGLLLAWQATERVLSLATPETAWGDSIQKLSRDPRAVGRWFPYLNRGSYYVDRDLFDLAIHDFETSATLGDMGMGSFNIGSLLTAKGRPQQALQMFDVAQKQGYDLYSLPFQRGLAYIALGRPADAYRELDIARSMQPPSPTREIMLINLARVSLQSNHPYEATLATRQLLEIQPGNIEARYLLAMSHIVQSQHDRALEALAGAPDTGPVHYARALAYHGLNRKVDAQREIEAAIRIGPPNPSLQQWRARIDAMR
jgi:tetratricopeptide (TPR) repeat protein